VVTGYGVRTGHLSVVALFFVGFGMWMFWSNDALVEAEPTASSMAPGGTLSALTASAGGQSSYEWAHELFGHLFHRLDFGSRGKLAGGAPVPKDWPVKKPVNIAHRGGKYIAPENTLVGFREGLRAGADVLELDVHLTADEHLVVIHDDIVDRTTNGTGLVREMTLQELKRLDAGYRFPGDDGKAYPYRGQGVAVPTLEEVYQEFPEVPLNVEIKEAQRGIEQALWQVIKEAEAADRTLVVSEQMSVIRRFREVSGERVATGSSGREIFAFYLLNRLHLSRLWSLIGGPSYQALQVPEELPEAYGSLQIVTPEFVRAAHQLDLRVDVWTINTERDMRRVLGYGVDGIMTDHPDVLNRVLEGEDKDK
jgi:glycerophosphoryl diester phosphodiesterase